MFQLLKRIFGPVYNILNWFRINLTHLGQWQEFWPPQNGRPTVLMVPAEPGHPFYETWRQGIEANGWNVRWLRRAWKLPVSHQLLLYFTLCPWVDVVHLIDVDLQTLFGEHNAIRKIISFAALRLMVLWAKLLGKLMVYSFGNVVPHEYDTPAEHKRHQLICSLVHNVTSHSPSIAEEMKSSGIPASRIWPAEQADISEFFKVPVDWPDFREQYDIPKDAIVLLQIGSIRPYKGIEIAVEAFKKSTNPNLYMVIAGKPSVTYTAEGIAELVAGDSRIILGPLQRLSNEEMGWIFRASDYCLLPYRDISHSSIICQSLGLGVPVIGSRLGCLIDYLDKGAGILFTANNVEELADIFDNLHTFGRADAIVIGLKIMRQRTPERIGQRLVRIYEYRRGGARSEIDWLF